MNVVAKTFEVHNGKKPEQTQETKLDYIIGNPPFIGAKIIQQSLRNDIVTLFENTDGAATLDYVTGWYIKAAKYI